MHCVGIGHPELINTAQLPGSWGTQHLTDPGPAPPACVGFCPLLLFRRTRSSERQVMIYFHVKCKHTWCKSQSTKGSLGSERRAESRLCTGTSRASATLICIYQLKLFVKFIFSSSLNSNLFVSVFIISAGTGHSPRVMVPGSLQGCSREQSVGQGSTFCPASSPHQHLLPRAFVLPPLQKVKLPSALPKCALPSPGQF